MDFGISPLELTIMLQLKLARVKSAGKESCEALRL
jgi:hypothetical protein